MIHEARLRKLNCMAKFSINFTVSQGVAPWKNLCDKYVDDTRAENKNVHIPEERRSLRRQVVCLLIPFTVRAAAHLLFASTAGTIHWQESINYPWGSISGQKKGVACLRLTRWVLFVIRNLGQQLVLWKYEDERSPLHPLITSSKMATDLNRKDVNAGGKVLANFCI